MEERALPAADPYPPELLEVVRDSGSRLQRRFEHETPGLAAHFAGWIGSLSAGRAEEYFTHRSAYPMLLLPWWLDKRTTGAPALELQSELVYSTLCGYYFVRMIDDLMDEQAQPPAPVLPASIVLHTEFQAAYQRLLPAHDDFWRAFSDYSYSAAETASVDATLETVTHDDFLRISGRKTAGAKIPLAAVAYLRGRPELLGPWTEMAELIGRWHQMRNDVVGWPHDLARGSATYFLSEARRRAGGADLIVEWVADEGLEWAESVMAAWMDDAISSARNLASEELTGYLDLRRQSAALEWAAIRGDLEAIRAVAPPAGARRRR